MTLHVQSDQWTANQTISNSGWTEIWSAMPSGTRGKFFYAVWQTNSNFIQFRLTYNGEVAMDLDLDEISSDFQLQATEGGFFGGGASGPPTTFILVEYGTNLWILRPPEAFFIDADQEVKIEMMSNTGSTYQAIRGISVWGQP